MRDDGQPLREADRYDIGIEPGIFFFGDYWSPDGYFLFPLEPGSYRVDVHGSRWLADTSPSQFRPASWSTLGRSRCAKEIYRRRQLPECD